MSDNKYNVKCYILKEHDNDLDNIKMINFQNIHGNYFVANICNIGVDHLNEIGSINRSGVFIWITITEYPRDINNLGQLRAPRDSDFNCDSLFVKRVIEFCNNKDNRICYQLIVWNNNEDGISMCKWDEKNTKYNTLETYKPRLGEHGSALEGDKKRGYDMDKMMNERSETIYSKIKKDYVNHVFEMINYSVVLFIERHIHSSVDNNIIKSFYEEIIYTNIFDSIKFNPRSSVSNIFRNGTINISKFNISNIINIAKSKKISIYDSFYLAKEMIIAKSIIMCMIDIVCLTPTYNIHAEMYAFISKYRDDPSAVNFESVINSAQLFYRDKYRPIAVSIKNSDFKIDKIVVEQINSVDASIINNIAYYFIDKITDSFANYYNFSFNYMRDEYGRIGPATMQIIHNSFGMNLFFIFNFFIEITKLEIDFVEKCFKIYEYIKKSIHNPNQTKKNIVDNVVKIFGTIIGDNGENVYENIASGIFDEFNQPNN